MTARSKRFHGYADVTQANARMESYSLSNLTLTRLCYALCTLGVIAQSALAQTAPAEPPKDPTNDANQAVLDAWKAQTGSAPELKLANTGSKLEWNVTLNIDAYNQDVTTGAAGNLNTPNTSQDIHKTQASVAWRNTEENGDVMLLQAAMLASNSRTILSKYSSQISSFQLGRTTSNYQIAAGDVTASFSPLGSTLGLRGLLGQVKFGNATFTAHGGTLAESWEALGNRSTIGGAPVRSSYLRDVFGIKGEYAINQELSIFATTQSFDDRESSLTVPKDTNGNPLFNALKAAKTQAHSVGSMYRKNALQVTAEFATSQFEEADTTSKRANAFVIDGTYALSTSNAPTNIRFGYHKVKNGFVTLGGAAQPGVEDIYGGVDWTVTPWLTWGTELRGAKQLVPQTSFSLAATRHTEAFTNRWNFNLNEFVQGLNASINDTYAQNRDNSQLNNGRRKQDIWNANISYSVNSWSLGGNLGWGKVESSVNAAEDSSMRSYQGSLSRAFVLGESSNGQPPATISFNLQAGEQFQKIVTLGVETKTTQVGLNLNGALYGKWTSNISLTFADTTQPTGGPKLKQTGYSLDVAYNFSALSNLRAYWRHNRRNQGVAALDTKEEVAGVNFNLVF